LEIEYSETIGRKNQVAREGKEGARHGIPVCEPLSLDTGVDGSNSVLE